MYAKAAIHDKYTDPYRQPSAFATVAEIFSLRPGTKSKDINFAPRQPPLSAHGVFRFTVLTLVGRASIFRYLIGYHFIIWVPQEKSIVR